ncbi:MAG: DNA helicase RecQ [Oscillospiraceae bacterium]|jgi:ATP-dependent DNA helicase RecQ|nr:DNA helicase RecQ [Oscillospiraceae bacterium]
MRATRILKTIFGYDAFRPGQQAVIETLLLGRDCLAVMPTGSGKSICFQLPALMLSGITIVLSPLISLMRDQVAALQQAGVAAAFLNSSLSAEQSREVLTAARQGRYKLLYVAPERLEAPAFAAACRELPIALVAVDEAHCVSHWGQDFRPSYLRIAPFIAGLPERPAIAAFTATATERVKADIAHLLALDDPFLLTTGFDRPNLRFETRALRGQGKFVALKAYLNEHIGRSGIVYCNTRKVVDALYADLCRDGFAAARYHAGLTPATRSQNQDAFVNDRCDVMVATNAFGMGIDKSNVGFVIHYNMPASIEAYYQEAGRAGRDGTEADCIVFYSKQDVQTNEFLINQGGNPDIPSEITEATRRAERERLRLMLRYCKTAGCLRQHILRYFGEDAPDHCGHCANCEADAGGVQLSDVTIEAQKILSCVKRMGERFGVTMVAGVLGGSKNTRIKQFGFEKLSTYGALSNMKQTAIIDLIDALVAEDLLEQTDDQYPVIKLGMRAPAVLREGERVVLRVKKAPKAVKPAPGNDHDDLFAVLKLLRLAIARQENAPAFVIFSDAALRDMCLKRPTNREEMLAVSGVGAVKWARYGEQFLVAIREFTTASGTR